MKKVVFFAVLAVTLLFSFNREKAGTESTLRNMEMSRVQDQVRMKLKKKQTFEGYHKGFFSPDGKLLVLMDKDHTDVLDVATNRQLYRINRPQSIFLTVAFSPNMDILAASYQDRSGSPTTVKLALWNAMTGQEMGLFPVVDPEWGRMVEASFSRDGRLLATNLGGVVRLWEVATRREVREFPPPSEPAGLSPERALLSPDGKWLAVDYRRFIPPLVYDVIKVWELETGREIVLETNVSRDWKFSSDSTILAISAKVDKGKITERSVAEFWEVGTWIRKRVIEAPPAWLAAFAVGVSPDSEILVIGGYKMFGLFSAATGTLLAEKRHPTGEFDSQLYYDLVHVEFSPDGKQVLTGGNDGTVKLWRIKQK